MPTTVRPYLLSLPRQRKGGRLVNPAYAHTFVFENDFAALRGDTPAGTSQEEGFFQSQSEIGVCRVICFSPRHDLTLARMAQADIRRVVDLWAEQVEELSQDERLGYVQLFENRGAMMGSSNPHPHGQVWATGVMPTEAARRTGSNGPISNAKALRCWWTIFAPELAAGEEGCGGEQRLGGGGALLGGLARSRTLLLPRRPRRQMGELAAAERDSLAGILKRLLTLYDNLFETSFPYSMGWHGMPSSGGDHAHWQLHAHFYPPLLRSATVRKFMVGYEMLATPQRDLTAEQAAERLRAQSEIHYLDR